MEVILIKCILDFTPLIDGEMTLQAAALELAAPEDILPSHCKHDVDPGYSLYELGGQTAHTPISSVKKPALHVQLIRELLPARDDLCCGHDSQDIKSVAAVIPENVPTGHFTQGSVPVLSLKVPGEHAEQVAPE